MPGSKGRCDHCGKLSQTLRTAYQSPIIVKKGYLNLRKVQTD